jgi:hypothetical protein
VWFAKPESLRNRIERAGIRLTRVRDEAKGMYEISYVDRDKLVGILLQSGQVILEHRHNGVLEGEYEVDVPFFYFWKREQRVSVNGINKLIAKFDPDI